MRPSILSFEFFFFLFTAVLVAAGTETISSTDKRISYEGDWREIEFSGGTFSYLRQSSGQATLRVFNASQIGVTVMVETPGETVRILLDDISHDVSPTTRMEPAWNSSNLDPSVPHTITVTKQNPNGRYLALYSFLVTSPDSTTIVKTATSAPSGTSSTENGTPTQQPAGQPELTATTKGIIAGTLAGTVCLGLLGALGIYFWRRRNKHDASLNPFGKVEEGTSPFQPTDALHASPARTDGISPFVDERRVETETDRAGKGGRPNGGTEPAPEGRPNTGEGASAFHLEGAAPSQPPPDSPSGHLSAPPPYVP